MQQAQNTGWQTLPDSHGTTCLLLPREDLAELGGWPAILYHLLRPLPLPGSAKAGHGKGSSSLEVKSSLIKIVFPLHGTITLSGL